jgi:hypothetical protein
MKENNDIPKWATRLTLAQVTLFAVAASAFSLLALLAQITGGSPTALGLALVFITAVIALRLWRVWSLLRKSRSTWHSDS